MRQVLTKITAISFFLFALCLSGQEDSPFVAYDIPTHNLLKFNRFLINPTFSTVRETKSYFNMQHRNQSVSFEDNYRAYFLSYSGRIGDRAGVGLGVFNQREGIVENYGILANYGYGIKLTEHSNFTFAANIIYYYSGVNQNRANPIEADPALLSLESSSLFSFQPGFNISYKNWDFGVFAENLIDFNLNTQESVSEFNEKIFTGHLQYTHQLKGARGLFENGRILGLARVRKVGETSILPGGSVLFDLPKAGWMQAGYDDFYGASAGVGFHVGKRVSLGYTIEKGLSDNFENFGINHEISLAYSFTPNLTERMVRLRTKKSSRKEALASNEPKNENELASLRKKLNDNNELLNEILDKMDTTEVATNDAAFEERYGEIEKDVVAKNDDAANNSKNSVNPNNVEPGFNTFNLSDVKSGFYLIANVYKSEKYVESFMKKLKRKGLEPRYFLNKQNGFKYVYLKKFSSLQEASKAYQTKLDGTFEDDMWIIKIDNPKNGNASLIFDNDIK